MAKNPAIWKNSKKLERLEVAILFLIWVFLGWLLTNAPTEEIRNTTGVFFALMTIAGVAYAGKGGIALQTVGFGGKQSALVMAAALGVGFALILTSGGFNVFNPVYFAVSDASVFGVSSALLFVGFVAPIVEEAFFRSTMMPTIAEWFGNAWYGLIGSSLAFGVFHYAVSAGNVNVMAFSVVFGLAVGYVNMRFQNTGFGYTAHLVNNLRFLGVF